MVEKSCCVFDTEITIQQEQSGWEQMEEEEGETAVAMTSLVLLLLVLHWNIASLFTVFFSLACTSNIQHRVCSLVHPGTQHAAGSPHQPTDDLQPERSGRKSIHIKCRINPFSHSHLLERMSCFPFPLHHSQVASH